MHIPREAPKDYLFNNYFVRDTPLNNSTQAYSGLILSIETGDIMFQGTWSRRTIAL